MEGATYSLKEAAEVVGYSTRTLTRAISAGELQGANTGRAIRISRVELARWWRSLGGGELFEDETSDDEENPTS